MLNPTCICPPVCPMCCSDKWGKGAFSCPCMVLHRESGSSSSSAGGSGAGASANVPAVPASVPELLTWVNSHKVTRGRPRRPPPQAVSDSVCLVGETSGRIKWIQPSGACNGPVPYWACHASWPWDAQGNPCRMLCCSKCPLSHAGARSRTHALIGLCICSQHYGILFIHDAAPR